MAANFQFDSLVAFWEMSGHGPYVWGAYAIFFSVLIALLAQNRMRKKTIKKKIKLARLRAS
jgi:heme exporter protein CcmD